MSDPSSGAVGRPASPAECGVTAPGGAPPPVGVLIETSTPPAQIPALARLAEDLGFREVWVAEDYFNYGGFTAAALALHATVRIQVGIGIVSSVARHPAVTAMEIASLAGAFPGRFIPGIGHGLPAWTDQMGLSPTSPLTALRECITSIQRLLLGETLDTSGPPFAFNSIALMHLADDVPPILAGVMGPRSLELSGRIADGTVLSILAGETYIRDALGHIQRGMKRTGRTSHLLPTFALFGIASDRAAARRVVRERLALYLSVLGPDCPLFANGYADKLRALMAAGDGMVRAQDVPEQWLDELCVCGDADDVAGRIRSLLAAGATSVVVCPADVADSAAQFEHLSKAVLPQLAVAGP